MARFGSVVKWGEMFVVIMAWPMQWRCDDPPWGQMLFAKVSTLKDSARIMMAW